MQGVDEKLLTGEERKRYSELLSAVANVRRSGAALNRPRVRMTFRDCRATVAVMMLWVPAVICALVLAVNEDQVPEPHPDPFMWMLTTIMLGGLVPITLAGSHDADVWRRKIVGDYLDSIGFRERVRPVARTARREDDSPYWATGTYDPERYYRETKGWSVHDREYIRGAYGDLDTYESNRPD